AVASDMQSHERPPMSKTDVKKLYQQAKKEYNSGDWNSARKHFEMARDYGYKPGLFEGDPPAKYLSRMDAKESADRARTERKIARDRQRQEQEAAVAQAPPQPQQPAEQPAPQPAPVTAPAEPSPTAIATPAPAPAPAPGAPETQPAPPPPPT